MTNWCSSRTSTAGISSPCGGRSPSITRTIRGFAFELFNEPYGNLTADKWNRLQAETIAVVRRSNPTPSAVA